MAKKKITPNESNLIKALRATAKAHNVEFHNWLADDGQVGIKSEDVPVVADVKSIVDAFATNASICVEVGYGYVTIFVDCAEYREEVNKAQLEMSLPYGLIVKWE